MGHTKYADAILKWVRLKTPVVHHGWQRLNLCTLSNELTCDSSTINSEPTSRIYCIVYLIAVPAGWRPGTSLTLPTISPSHCLQAMASFVGFFQVPRAAARRLAADGGRQKCR